MANETTIDKETARRLLLILSLEGDVKREEIEWALAIIHQIRGYGGITLAKAAQDGSLKEILAAIAAEQISPTTPKNLPALIKEAGERKAALKAAEETGEKKAEEFIEAAEKAAKTKAQVEAPPAAPEAPAPVPETPAPTQPVPEGFSIRVSPKFVEKLGKKAAFAPFTVAKFLSPRLLQENPAVATSLATSIPLSELSKKAEGFPEAERVKILRFLEAIKEARYSTVARMQLPMKIASITGIQATLMEGSEMGLPQGQVAAIIQTAKVSGPSFLGGLGRQALGGIAQRAISKGVTKLATKAITTALGTAVAPGVGTAISLVADWLVGKAKDFLSWMTRNAPKVAIGIGAFLFGTGFVLQSSLLMGSGALVGAGGLVGQAGGVGPALSQAGGFASSVITGITSLAVASIATPLIVALISIPVLVAIILFIINSGAYLVPPKGEILPGFLESPYIKVEKKASPPGPFQNSQLPLNNITYTISVSALRGALTNVRFEYSCRVYKKGSKPPCPSVSIKDSEGKEITLGEQENLVISPTNPYILTYTASYGTSFSDSAVIDTFVVTADTPDQTDAVSSGGATIIIGKPPLGCFIFNNNVGPYFKVYSLGWEKYPIRMQKVMNAIVTLSTSSNWLDYVCRGGEVVLTHARQEGGWGAWAPSATAKDIIFYSTYGITEGSSSGYSLYLFAHESGHLIDYHNSIAASQYRELAAHEGFLPTYPVCCRSAGEDLAESIGRYPINHPILEEPRFQGHKEFAKFIFGIDF